MEPVTPTSFIPKRPVVTTPTADNAASGVTVGIVSLITVVVVIGTAASYAGVYFYKQQVEQEKIALQKTITQAKDGLGADFISDMKRLNDRIDGVKKLLNQHVVVSPIFKALQDTTLQSIQYKDFSYELATDSTTKTDMVKVKVTGTAKSYATIALQADAFSQSDIIKNPVFSNLSVDDKKRVTFTLNFSVLAANLSYQTFIDTLAKTTQQNAAPAAASPAPVMAPTQQETTGATVPVITPKPVTITP